MVIKKLLEMNGTAENLNGGTHQKEEIVDFSGKGLKLNTEADGMFHTVVLLIITYDKLLLILPIIYQQHNPLLMQLRLPKD